ncbi:MAG: hypothetical protein HY290_03435 [Planctomycetia bacterium]|nr:hypothetical protein [Planctomycetia bacterium]
MEVLKKITKSQLKAIVNDYERLMPGWKRVAPDVLARADGPLCQCIGFESLRFGEYRPMNYVDALIAPEPDTMGAGSFFFQIVRGSPGTLTLRTHADFCKKMLGTMEREFRPAIHGPFRAQEVLGLCEKEAITKGYQAYALAALNAYFGYDDRARYWCAQFPKLVEKLAYPWEEWDIRRKTFLEKLQQWLTDGVAKAELEANLKAERAKWGLA